MSEPHKDPLNGAEIVLKALRDQGVEFIFGYPGGAVLPLYDAIFQQDDIQHVLVRHEQGATHAAEGYARSTGKVGVVLVTSGPGATNAVTGLTDALMDSHPDGLHDRPGGDASDRQRRLPGVRHGRHHPALHQAQLAGEGRQRSGRVIHEAFYVAAAAGPGRSWSISRRTCSVARRPIPAEEHRAPHIPAAAEGRSEAIREAVDLMATRRSRCSIPAAASSIPARGEPAFARAGAD